MYYGEITIPLTTHTIDHWVSTLTWYRSPMNTATNCEQDVHTANHGRALFSSCVTRANSVSVTLRLVHFVCFQETLKSMMLESNRLSLSRTATQRHLQDLKQSRSGHHWLVGEPTQKSLTHRSHCTMKHVVNL